MLPLIGEFVVRFTGLVYSMEYFLLDWVTPWEPGYDVRSFGEKCSRILPEFQKEMLQVINTSPWLTARQKSSARAELVSIVKDIKIANKYRNIVAHSHWLFWEPTVPQVAKSSTRIRRKEYWAVTPDDLKEWINVTKLLDNDIYEMEQKYRYGTGIKVSKILWNRHEKNLARMRHETSIETLKNITPNLAFRLERVGINTPVDLINLGANESYKRLIRDGLRKHKRVLYSLVGAIQNRHWVDVAKESSR